MKLVRLGLAIMVVVSSPASGNDSDFVVVQQTINPVVQPKSAADAARECANDSVCSGLVDAAASYFGVQPGAVSAAMAAIPKPKSQGEESWFEIHLPQGYEYCRSKIETVSVVPATGDRASLMAARARVNHVYIYTWTPRRGLGGPRSWVEAKYTVLGVKQSLAEQARQAGTCRSNKDVLIIDCRGATGVNNGLPACGVAAD